MRIAIFSDNFYPELSGISDSIIVLGKELARRGHFIDFYVPAYTEKDYALASVNDTEIDLGKNIQVIRFSSLPWRMGTGQGRFVIPTGWRAIKIFQFHPDVIHTQLFFGVGLEAIFAARVLLRPVIGTNHTVLKEFLKYSPFHSRWFTNGLLKYMNWYYERCEVVTAPSQSVLDSMAEIGFKNIKSERVISNPIDNELFKPPTRPKEELKKELGLSGPVIVYAGRFAPEKKIDVLIDAVAIAAKQEPKIMLALAGHGTLQDELTARAEKLGIAKNVRFMGTLSKENLAKLYQAGEVCATASTSEVQSITMLSAMASGLPIIGVNAPGLAEHIHDGNGLLARPDDPEDLAKTLLTALQNPTLLKKMSVGAMDSVKRFSAAEVATEWEKVYAAVIKSYNERNRIT